MFACPHRTHTNTQTHMIRIECNNCTTRFHCISIHNSFECECSALGWLTTRSLVACILLPWYLIMLHATFCYEFFCANNLKKFIMTYLLSRRLQLLFENEKQKMCVLSFFAAAFSIHFSFIPYGPIVFNLGSACLRPVTRRQCFLW